MPDQENLCSTQSYPLIKYAHERGIRTVLFSTLTTQERNGNDCLINRYTLKEIPELLRFCRERGILPYFESYIVHGQSKETQRDHCITSRELTQLFREIARIDRDEFSIDVELKPGMRIYHADACLKPEYGFAVKANGDVLTCPTDVTKTIGNVKNTALTAILSPNNQKYREGFCNYGCCATFK